MSSNAKVYTATGLGSMLTIQCITGLINPAWALRNFGMAPTPTDNLAIALVPVFGARNAAAGLTAIWFAWTGNVRQAGQVLTVFAACCGFGDVYGCIRAKGNWVSHAGGTVVFGALGLWLMSE